MRNLQKFLILHLEYSFSKSRKWKYHCALSYDTEQIVYYCPESISSISETYSFQLLICVKVTSILTARMSVCQTLSAFRYVEKVIRFSNTTFAATIGICQGAALQKRVEIPEQKCILIITLIHFFKIYFSSAQLCVRRHIVFSAQ